MTPDPFNQYLSWRQDHLERAYWRLTTAVRLSGILAFGLVMGAASLLLMRFREDPTFGTLYADVLGASLVVVVGMFVLTLVAVFSIHIAARFRRHEVLDELEILYALPTGRPKPAAEWDAKKNAFTPVERRFT